MIEQTGQTAVCFLEICKGWGDADVVRGLSGGEYALEIAQIVGCQRACMKAGSPSRDKEGIASEILTRRDIKVIRVG